VSATPQSTDSVTRYIIIAIALVAVAALIWSISEVLVIGFGAVVFATVLRAMSVPLARVTHWSERVCLGLVIVALILVFGVLFWLFGRQATRQFAEMQERLPVAAEKFQAWLAETELGGMLVDGLKEAMQGGGSLSNAGTVLAATVGGVGNLLLIIFAGIYLAADPVMYRNGSLRLLPPSRRPQVGRALADAGVALHHWLIAQIVIMLAVGVLTGGGLALLGVPLSLSLGLIAGLLEFVPVVGPIVAAIPGVLLAFARGPETAFYVLLLYIAVQQIESNVLTPLIQRWAVELPPVIALLSIVACGLVFGVMGVIFATPMAVVVMAMVKHLYVEDTLENGKPQRAAAGRTRERGG
jgi:predicted PurR-regulated permease PerM